MKVVTTAKLPKKTPAKVNDPNNPARTEKMLGAPVFKRDGPKQLVILFICSCKGKLLFQKLILIKLIP
jgi:hypothetical protein